MYFLLWMLEVPEPYHLAAIT